tara:strand:+ start:115 stop:633 length:519 start_codon:yes stop_codon:yes gene_type:complete
MAITAAEYSAIYSINADQQTALEATHAEGHLAHLAIHPEDNPFIAGVLKEIKDLQREIDYLRTEISANKDKASFPGLGTSGSTALAGDTTVISKAQASAITANTAKTSMSLGTSGSTALAGDTNIVTIGSSTTISFGDMITVPAKGKTPASYSIVMTVTNGGVNKSTTLTLT